MKTTLGIVTMAVFAVLAARATALADDIDITAFEYVDVVETVEGSVWKGVVIEETPNVLYKIATADGSVHVIRATDVVKVSKLRNPRYRIAHAVSIEHDRVDADDAQLSAARPVSGVRIEPQVAIVIPRGDLVNLGGTPLGYRTSYAPSVHVGYEIVQGNLGWTVGGLARWTSWRLPTEIEALGTHWTLETQVYGRGAVHVGRVAPYAGVSLGLDTNYSSNRINNMSVTAMGFGMNIEAGITITASRQAALELGLDLHPGTDNIDEGVDASVSYYAFRLGASLRL